MKIIKLAQKWGREINIEVEIWKEDLMVGKSVFSNEEAKHFLNAPVCSARVALSDFELENMGLSADDEITIVKSEPRRPPFGFGSHPGSLSRPSNIIGPA